MPRYSNTKNNFLGGELSGRADGRSELQQYQSGCKELKNFVVMPDGGVTKRPGTRFVDKITTSETVRLLPFIVSKTAYYLILLWVEGGVNKYEVVDGVTGQSVPYTLDPGFVPDSFDSLTDSLQYAQSADLMFVACSGMRPFVVYRTGNAGSYTFTFSRYVDGARFTSTNQEFIRVPYLDENPDTGPTIAFSGASVGSTITLTASSGIFTTESAGSYYRIGPQASAGYVIVTAYTSATVVTAKVLAAIPGSSPTANWAESAWSPRRGWPAAITTYNQRLAFGGTKSRPDTFWLSQVGDFYEMHGQGSTALTAAMNYTLSDPRVNNIQWMMGGKKLSIGTIGGETVGVVQEDGTSLNVQFGQDTAHGSSYIQPCRVNSTIPFVQAAGHKVRELVYDYNSDSFVANDLTLLKGDLAEGPWNGFSDENKIRQMDYQEAPYPIIWFIDDAGFLYGLTRDRQQQVAAWHTHLVGGRVTEADVSGLSGPDHQAMVKSIAVTPDPQGAGGRLWMIVRRTTPTGPSCFLEFMDRFRYMDRMAFVGNADNWFYYLDCAKGVQSVSDTTTFSGFAHLAGMQVTAMVDGKSVGTVTVDVSGVITSPVAGRVCVAGFPYRARMKTSRSEGGSSLGSSSGALRRADEIRLNTYKSRFFKYGFEGEANVRQESLAKNLATQADFHDSRLEPARFVDPQEVLNQPFYTFSGFIRKAAPAGYDDKAVAIVLSDEPYPCTILNVTTRAVEADV